MSSLLTQISDQLDKLTGTTGSFGYSLIILLAVLGYYFTSSSATPESMPEEEEPDPPRNFTEKQLRHFNGEKEDRGDELKPIYLSLNGTVFDCSHGRDFYGPEGPYAAFAGRECGVALAKMSFDEIHLDDMDGCAKLERHEREELDGWIDKFKYYRPYPIVGRLIPDSKLPDPQRVWTIEELEKHIPAGGGGEEGGSDEKLPDGYAASPIYLGAADKVFDMSFGGVTFYGPGGPYSKFVGRDVTRALALMSLDDDNFESAKIDDLTEKQVKTVKDWVKTFQERKQYPIVGRLEKTLPDCWENL